MKVSSTINTPRNTLKSFYYKLTWETNRLYDLKSENKHTPSGFGKYFEHTFYYIFSAVHKKNK